MSMHVLGEPVRIECKSSDLKTRVLPLLHRRIFHVTTLERFELIRNTGSIKNNRDGKLSRPSGHWNSFGRRKGYVCLFDLRTATKAMCIRRLSKYNFLNPFYNDNAHVYLFISEYAWPDLIPSECATKANKKGGWKGMYIPDVEAWYPGDIPVSLVTDTLMVTVQPPKDTDLTAAIREGRKAVKRSG